MRIDYEAICKLAAEIGCRRDDLIALADSNDPFYVGVPARKRAAEWFASLWHTCGWTVGSHPRRLHYNLISRDPAILKPNGEPYQNTENDWKFFGTASLGARYHKLIPDGALSDHRNDPPIIFASNLGSKSPVPEVYGASGAGLGYEIPEREVTPPYLAAGDLTVSQPYLVEVWVEKSTMNDILVPLASRLGFNLVSGIGETSEVMARQAVERAADDGRPMRILYVSDFDPGGRSMPVALARKVEFWLREADLDLDITLDPIVLTPQQCQQYRLPRTPLKETERRAARFEERFGSGATELDALESLHPGELARVVRSEVCRYVDPTLSGRVRTADWEFNRKVAEAREAVLSRYDISDIQTRYADLVRGFRENVEALEVETRDLWPTITADLQANAPAYDQADMPAPRPATPPPHPLFDSKRGYVEQIDHYRTWQGKGETA